MHWLLSVNGWIRRILNVVVIITAVGLTATMTTQVIMRYILQSSLMGVEEMATLSGLWLYFAGFALVSARNQHIRGGFITVIPEHIQVVIDRVFLASCSALCLYFFLLSLDYAQFVYDINRRSTYMRWPTFFWVASLSIGLLLSFITLAIQAISPAKKAEP